VLVHVQQIQVLGADAVLLYAVAAISELGLGSVRRIRYFERPCPRPDPQVKSYSGCTQKAAVPTPHTQESVIRMSCAAASDLGG